LKPKRKALLIGICYLGQRDSRGNNLDLTLPWKDVERLKILLNGEEFSLVASSPLTLLQEKYGYHNNDIVTMTDRHSTEERLKPTHENIVSDVRKSKFPHCNDPKHPQMRELQAFLEEQASGDQYVFFCRLNVVYTDLHAPT
jgi:hypothetical protein